MGYYFNMRDQDFKIEPQRVHGAHKAILQYLEGNLYFEHFKDDCYVRRSRNRCNGSFEECMGYLGYGIEKSSDGGYDQIWLDHEKFDDEDGIFQILAPFVSDGSFIEFCGEDGAIWRYAFNNGEFAELSPKIEWV